MGAVGRSREGAWIEILTVSAMERCLQCRSREGAWIEMLMTYINIAENIVAPVRERGLKY